MPGVTPKDRDSMVKEIRPQLDAALESGKTDGIPQGWIDAAKVEKSHDKDPKFSLYMPEDRGGPTDEELMALSKALNPSMFTKFKRMIGMKEGNLRLTENQLRRVIRKALLREAFRGEGQFIEDLTPEQIAMWEFGYEIGKKQRDARDAEEYLKVRDIGREGRAQHRSKFGHAQETSIMLARDLDNTRTDQTITSLIQTIQAIGSLVKRRKEKLSQKSTMNQSTVMKKNLQ